MKPSIYSLTRQDMIDWAEENGEKKFRAAQIWEWLYRKRVQSFEEMTNLSKDLIVKLNDQFVVNPLKQRIVQESADGTVKYLFELPDGMFFSSFWLVVPCRVLVFGNDLFVCDCANASWALFLLIELF